MMAATVHVVLGIMMCFNRNGWLGVRLVNDK